MKINTPIYRTEWHRMRRGVGTKLAILLALTLAIWQFVDHCLPVATTDYYAMYPDSDWGAPYPLWTVWLGGEMLSLPSYLYRLLLPILAVLPFAGSYGTDIYSGYARQLLIRTDKRRYLRAKLFTVWFSGGAAGVLPLVLNFLLAVTVLPLRGPNRMDQNLVGSKQLFGELFANSPFAYLLLAGGVIFAFCGAFALIALFISLYVRQPFLILVTPFTLYLGVDVIARRLDPINADQFLPMQFLHPQQWQPGRPEIVFTELILLLLLFGGGFYAIASKRDTF